MTDRNIDVGWPLFHMVFYIHKKNTEVQIFSWIPRKKNTSFNSKKNLGTMPHIHRVTWKVRKGQIWCLLLSLVGIWYRGAWTRLCNLKLHPTVSFFFKRFFIYQIWAVNKSCSEVDFLWMLQKVKWSLYASIFRLLVFFWRLWPPRNACNKKGFLHDGLSLSLPDYSAVLIYWGKCTYVASVNTNALCSSIGEYKPVGLSVIVCLT